MYTYKFVAEDLTWYVYSPDGKMYEAFDTEEAAARHCELLNRPS